MQRTAIPHTPATPSELEFQSSFNVVIAYEDFETGKNAKKTYDVLAANLGHECQFFNQMWKFDVLSIPKLREIAAKDAALAEIVIISCRGGELPDHIKAWIELWIGAENARPVALVALFANPVDYLQESRETRAYLAGVAQRGDLEFFAQPEEPKARGIEEFLSGDSSADREKRISTLAGLMSRETSMPRWGINE